MSSYDESEEYDGGLAELFGFLGRNGGHNEDIISVDGVSDDRDEYGEYQWMNIDVLDGETGEILRFHLEGDELSQDILDEIADYAEEVDATVNPAYGLGE